MTIPINRARFESVEKAFQQIKSVSQAPQVILMLDLCYVQLKKHAVDGGDYGLPFPIGIRFEVFGSTFEMMERAHLLAKSGKRVMVCE